MKKRELTNKKDEKDVGDQFANGNFVCRQPSWECEGGRRKENFELSRMGFVGDLEERGAEQSRRMVSGVSLMGKCCCHGR